MLCLPSTMFWNFKARTISNHINHCNYFIKHCIVLLLILPSMHQHRCYIRYHFVAFNNIQCCPLEFATQILGITKEVQDGLKACNKCRVSYSFHQSISLSYCFCITPLFNTSNCIKACQQWLIEWCCAFPLTLVSQNRVNLVASIARATACMAHVTCFQSLYILSMIWIIRHRAYKYLNF